MLDAVGGTDLVLAGHSMGGMTIQAFAAGHPDVFRDRVRGIVLVATAAQVLPRPLPGPIVDRVLGDAGLARLADRGITSGATRGAVGREAHRAHVQATHDAFVGTSGAARAGFLVGMSRMDYRTGLAQHRGAGHSARRHPRPAHARGPRSRCWRRASRGPSSSCCPAWATCSRSRPPTTVAEAIAALAPVAAARP